MEKQKPFTETEKFDIALHVSKSLINEGMSSGFSDRELLHTIRRVLSDAVGPARTRDVHSLQAWHWVRPLVERLLCHLRTGEIGPRKPEIASVPVQAVPDHQPHLDLILETLGALQNEVADLRREMDAGIAGLHLTIRRRKKRRVESVALPSQQTSKPRIVVAGLEARGKTKTELLNSLKGIAEFSVVDTTRSTPYEIGDNFDVLIVAGWAPLRWSKEARDYWPRHGKKVVEHRGGVSALRRHIIEVAGV
jgi:hypothetical protein